MSRSAIIGLAVLVLGGLGALWFLVIRDDGATPTGGSAATPTPAAEHATGPGPTLPTPPPTLTTATHPIDQDPTGMVVTDHRTPSGGPRVLPAEAGSGEGSGRRLTPSLIRSIHGNASALAQGCAHKVALGDRGPKPRIGAQLKVGIKDGALRVLDVMPEVADLGGPELDAVKSCLHDALLGLELPTPDEADLDTYDLQLDYVVR